MSLSSTVFVFLISVIFIAGEDIKLNTNNDKWWRSASFYQIYPRSFKDSNGDGVGDLKGIEEKLPYLKEIGITATWISPIFPSPMADFGYDISNFTDIDPIFGNMDDFDALIKKANELGIKILLDFVPNHTSDKSQWFQKSVARDPEFKDFYMWHPGKVINGTRHPPSNWVSRFRGSAWEWNDQRQEYYYHPFLVKQPDLNYRNPRVKEAMKEVMTFWLKKGVAGFRCDAVPNVYEIAPDANGNFPDEPRNFNENDPESYDYLEHIYTVDQPESVEVVIEWRQLLDDFKAEHGGDDRVLMIETWSPIDIVMQYFGNETNPGAQFPFNFQMMTYLSNASDANHFAQIINSWLDKMPEGNTANWVLGNHDSSRVGSRFGSDRIDMLNMLLLTLPGASVTYLGEETGMTDVWMSWNDTQDPQACNSNPDLYEKLSRDICRSPFQWSDEMNAGFSTATKTWLPVSGLYPLVNVKRERGIAFSHLNIFKQLQSLRSERTMRYGDVLVKAVSESVLAFQRFLLNERIYIILLNLMDNVELVNLASVFPNVPQDLEYVVVTAKSQRRKGDQTYADQITLYPIEAVVLRTLH